MKKISLLLVALVAVFCVSCSNDPKVEGEFVKAVDEAIAQLMATMKEAAAGKLVRTLAALGEKLGSEAGAQ